MVIVSFDFDILSVIAILHLLLVVKNKKEFFISYIRDIFFLNWRYDLNCGSLKKIQKGLYLAKSLMMPQKIANCTKVESDGKKSYRWAS